MLSNSDRPERTILRKICKTQLFELRWKKKKEGYVEKKNLV